MKPGSAVDYGERRLMIMHVISFETAVARDAETGDLERLPSAGSRAIVSADLPLPAPDLAELDDRHWAEARRRLGLIKPVLENAIALQCDDATSTGCWGRHARKNRPP